MSESAVPLRARWLDLPRPRDPEFEQGPDAALVARMAQDDVAALLELYRRHGRLVYAVARRAGGLDLAAALTRNAFLTVWRRAGRAGAADPASLRRQLLDNLDDDVEDRVRTGCPETAERAPSSTQLLGALPVAEARVLTLIVVGDCTYRETASLLGSSEPAVRRAAVRGFRRLTGLLANPAG